MTVSTYERYLVVQPAYTGGMTVRTAASLKELITELLLNSGEEIAFWAEDEAKRCAEIWRKPVEATPDDEDGEG